jgi:hypothetical protein
MGLLSIVREATRTAPDFSSAVCNFHDLTSPVVLAAFEDRLNGPPKNDPLTFTEYMIYECARDRRSLGTSLLYATELDAPFNIDGLEFISNGYTIKPVTSAMMFGCCKRLFVSTGLLGGTPKEIALDMQLYSKPPYYMLSCTGPDDALRTAAVFRVHGLNNGNRLIALDLLASAFKDGVGGGTVMMRTLQDLSKISPRHPGHISAATLRTRKANKFYGRQLPSCNSPQDRAFLVSVAFLEADGVLKYDLDSRSATFWPTGTHA